MTVSKRGDRYVVRIELGRDASGRRVQDYKRFKTRKEAKNYETEVLGRLSNGQPGKDSDETFADFVWNRYLPSVKAKGARPNTLTGYERYFRLHILPVLGHVRLCDLTTLMIDEFYAAFGRKPYSGHFRSGTQSPRSVVHAHTLINQSLAAAVRWRLLRENPAAKASPPRKQVWHKEALSWDETEAAAFLAWLGRQDRHRALWYVFLTTGMRRGEVLGLQWRDIDWDNQTIKVERSLMQLADRRLELASTKTVKGLRTLKVGSELLDELRKHERRQKLDRWAAGDKWIETDHVFTRMDGRPMIPSSVSDHFLKQLARAIEQGLPVKRITLHGLRHTFVTLQVRAGVHTRIISERAGHHSAQYTVDTYGHVDVGAQLAAADIIQGLLQGQSLRQVQRVERPGDTGAGAVSDR